jgi:2-amino-4-hydroxy-6-hydroxymethyldihydropteridine diphosphokinase
MDRWQTRSALLDARRSRIVRTGVALGSNLGDRLANLRAARKAIVNLPGIGPPVLNSSIYETEPVDCEPGATKFLNAVVEFDYDGDPTELLERLTRIEKSLGREREHVRNISRKIDIDLLYAGDLSVENEQLQLPHPRLHLRGFVLQPLKDVRPDLVLPNQTKTVRELLADAGGSATVQRLDETW